MFKVNMNIKKAFFFGIFVLIIIPVSYATPGVYLNDSTEFQILLGSANKTLGLSSNLTLDENINHSFDANTNNAAGRFDVEYVASNTTGFLLRLRIDKTNDQIQKVDCVNTSDLALTTICDGGCGGNDFGVYHLFTLQFNPTSLAAKLFIDNAAKGDIAVCINATQIGSVKFSRQSGLANIKNNLLLADNKPPQFIGNLPNITWPEDTSTDFNISGNFSDPNNDTLTFSYTTVNNITISINNNSGIVNLTPDPGFFGSRYVKFIANDGDNTTFSNNVTLTVTNVNDAPTITSATITNSDFLNRTNGTLTASWTFSDVDNATMERNEIVWRNNSYEVAELANYTTITSNYTKKNQNWSFSVRVFDGLDWSGWNYSSNTTIQNSLQYFNHTLGVVQAERNQSFVYDVNYTDLDDDSITFYDNSSLFGITNEGIINFTPVAIGNITVNVTMSQSPELNPNVSEILTIEVADTLAPDITSISTSNSGTTTVTVTLSVTTDEIAVCRFSTSPADNYSNMTQMSSTNSTSHSNAQSFNSDTSGTYYVMCNDTYGNAMNYSNSTNFNADVQESSGGNTGGGGGGGAASDGKSGRECKYKWECSGWSECKNGKQARNCEKVRVMPFYSGTECDSEKDRETSRECEEKKAEEPKAAEEPKEEAQIEENPIGQEPNQITGRVIFSGLTGKIKNPGYTIMAILILIAICVSLYFRYFRVPSSELSEEELKRLHKQLESQLKKGL